MDTRVMLLGECFSFKVGTNLSRLKDVPKECAYLTEDLMDDLAQMRRGCLGPFSALPESCMVLHAGDIVFGLISKKAAVVSSWNAGKLLRNSEVVCIAQKGVFIDPWYFCFLMNETDMIRQAFSKLTLGHLRMLRASDLDGLSVNIADMETQKRIGSIYKTACHLSALNSEKTKQQDRLISILLNKINKGE